MKQAERDYSSRSLFEKLGLTSDAHVAVCGNNDRSFLDELAARLANSASKVLRTKYDLIFLKIDAPRDLEKIANAAKHLRPNGALWIFHPKGRGANPPDAAVRRAGLAAGLVDNKISAYTDTHTATRYVIPVAKRASS